MGESVEAVKSQKRAMVDRHAHSNNASGALQVLVTLAPLPLLMYLAVGGVAEGMYAFTAVGILLMSLFLLRVFVLMHDCGHGSLFRSPFLNRACGFMLGVVCGMPQFVWSQHHDFHHRTNGNWAKYRGPLNILSLDEYQALSPRQQRRYRWMRKLWLAPFGGFLYLILNPRLTWMLGSVRLLGHMIAGKARKPRVSLRAHAETFRTPYWTSRSQYWHMFWNNVALITAWSALAAYFGPALFFGIYLTSLSLAGGAGIILFTVQHNFEQAYASSDENWDYDTAAIHGTSFLVLPGWLNWFTANIGYHHVHHLSSRIPNYRLARCHREYRHLFGDVRRVTLWEIPAQLNCILWDRQKRRIVPLTTQGSTRKRRVAVQR